MDNQFDNMAIKRSQETEAAGRQGGNMTLTNSKNSGIKICVTGKYGKSLGRPTSNNGPIKAEEKQKEDYVFLKIYLILLTLGQTARYWPGILSTYLIYGQVGLVEPCNYIIILFLFQNNVYILS